MSRRLVNCTPDNDQRNEQRRTDVNREFLPPVQAEMIPHLHTLRLARPGGNTNRNLFSVRRKKESNWSDFCGRARRFVVPVMQAQLSFAERGTARRAPTV